MEAPSRTHIGARASSVPSAPSATTVPGDRVDVIGIGNPTVEVFFVLGGERARFIVLDAGDTTLMIVVVSVAGAYEAFLQTAQAVIDSLAFT